KGCQRERRAVDVSLLGKPPRFVHFHVWKRESARRIEKLHVKGPPAFFRNSKDVLAVLVLAETLDVFRVGKSVNLAESASINVKIPDPFVLTYKQAIPVRSRL